MSRMLSDGLDPELLNPVRARLDATLRAGLLAVCAGLALAASAAAEVPFTASTVNLGAADTPWSVVTADLDADGDVDVLSASQLDDAVRWYESDGATPPTFTARVVTTSLDGASAVHVADVDRDGDLDVVASAILGNEVAWYESDGASPPVFTEHLVDTSANAARSVYSGDLDRDGDLDLLAAHELDDTIAWYESDGATPPGFTKHVISSIAMGATSVSCADVDADGDLDVLSTSESDATLAWYENDGAAIPGFTRRVIFDQSLVALWHATADLDGDGDLDVALAATGDNMVAWFENDGASPPVWTGHILTFAAQGARAVAVGDVDSDGDVDLVTASEFDDKVSWFENDGAASPGFTKHDIFDAALGASAVALADLDSDGDLDLLSSSFDDDHIRWYSNGSLHHDLGFGERRVVSAGETRVRRVAVADIDRDGWPDIESSALASGETRWFENDGASPPGFASALVGTDPGANSVQIADLDSDGDPDLLVVAGASGAIREYENDGATPPGLAGSSLATNLGTVSDAAAGDLDSDGDVDIVVPVYQEGTLVRLENDGASPPTFTLWLVGDGAHGAAAVELVDLDRDGRLDVLSAQDLDGDVRWFDNDGGGLTGFTERSVGTGTPEARAARAVDLDRDGDLDVVVASAGDDTLVWFESDGAANPGFTRHDIDTAASGVSDVAVADFDLDGDLDIAAALADSAEVAVYASDGAPLPGFAAPIRLAAGGGVHSLAVADMDRDGRQDLVAGSALDDTVAWYPNESGQYRFAVTPTSAAELLQGARSMLLAIDVTHLGAPGEGDIEVAALALRFEKSGGAALANAEFNAIVDTVEFYADDGSGEFEQGSDTLVLNLGGPIPLSDGVRVFPLGDGLGALQIPVGGTIRLFAVLELDAAASSQPLHEIRVVHAPDQGSAAEESATDFPLRPADVSRAGTSVLDIVAMLPECDDGIDNDLDSFIDFPDDPGCKNAKSASQEAPECDDGIDNDVDGFTDFPADAECPTAFWVDESQRPKKKGPHCGIGFELVFILPLWGWARRRRALNSLQGG